MCISKKIPPAKQENLYYIPPAKQEHLIAVTNRHLFDEAGGQPAFLARLEQVAAAHPAAVILREKDMEEGDYEVLARKVQILCCRHQVTFIAHTFAGAAKHLCADGLHLPEVLAADAAGGCAMSSLMQGPLWLAAQNNP